MATVAGLGYPTMVEANGILYLTGWRDGAVYFRRTVDGGATWSEERPVCDGADEVRAGLVKMESQGRRLVAAVARGEEIGVYVSVDDGETWVSDGVV